MGKKNSAENSSNKLNDSSYTSLKKQLDSASVQLLSVQKSIEDRISQLKILEDEWNSKCNLMEANANKAQSTVKLDVGGKIFKTTKETLLSKKDTFFYAMISSGKWNPDDDGSYFIDRNPKLFPYILDYLRYGKVDLSPLSEKQLQMLEAEADYYLITEMFGNNGRDMEKKVDTGVCKDSFNTDVKGTYTILSDGNKTATASTTGHTAAIGVCAISKGKRTWKLRMNRFASQSHWIMVGVMTNQITHLNNSYSNQTNYALSSTNQKYTAGVTTNSTASGDWMVGHVVQVELDCDNHTLTIKNLNTDRSEMWSNLPVNTYYLHANMYNANDSVTILDE